MRRSLIPTIAVVALLVLAGCTGPGTTNPQAQTPTPTAEAPETTTTEPKAPPDVSPDTFPSASDINPSVFERHATVMGNTSFTLAIQRNRTDRNAEFIDANFTYSNRSQTILFDTNDSHFLERTPTGSVYSDGEMRYMYSRANNWTKNQGPLSSASLYNRSSENYLWSGIFTAPVTDTIAINATYERKDAEWFHGTAVMRYEATGVDALPERVRADTPENETYEDFSATLLLDEDGIIRHYHYTFEKPPKDHLQPMERYERSYTLTDIGTTDVEKPDWVTELQENE